MLKSVFTSSFLFSAVLIGSAVVVFLGRSFVAGTAFLLLGLLICPPVRQYVHARTGWALNRLQRAGILVAVIVLAFVAKGLIG